MSKNKKGMKTSSIQELFKEMTSKELTILLEKILFNSKMRKNNESIEPFLLTVDGLTIAERGIVKIAENAEKVATDVVDFIDRHDLKFAYDYVNEELFVTALIILTYDCDPFFKIEDNVLHIFFLTAAGSEIPAVSNYLPSLGSVRIKDKAIVGYGKGVVENSRRLNSIGDKQWNERLRKYLKWLGKTIRDARVTSTNK